MPTVLSRQLLVKTRYLPRSSGGLSGSGEYRLRNAMSVHDRSLRRYGLVALGAALATISLKGGAWWLTGSVALLSDALESLVNVVTSLIGLLVLAIASRPADEEHAYGHTKTEYFASGFEGAMIFVASVSVAFVSVGRLMRPVPLEEVGLGIAVTIAATVINFVAARVLFSAGGRYGSVTLESGAHHLMADVWTSVAVVVGVALAGVTGWSWLDPLLALAVAGNILRTGWSLIHRSMLGLIDTALPEETRTLIMEVLEHERPTGIEYHAVRTRRAGRWAFVSMHVLVPGQWSVQEGHDLLEHIEARVREAVPNCTVFTHLEPIEDPVSFQDTELHRPNS